MSGPEELAVAAIASGRAAPLPNIPPSIVKETTVKTVIRLHLFMATARNKVERRIRTAWQCEQGDVTSTVIMIAVLVAAAVAAGVVITNFISGQTSKIS